MNKKGAEITLNTIIIAILVVLVLISVVIFFTVGFGNVTKNIKNIFTTSTAYDKNLAILNCKNYCDALKEQAASQNVDIGTIDQDNVYCKVKFDIDENRDGSIAKGDSKEDDVGCNGLGVSCSDTNCN